MNAQRKFVSFVVAATLASAVCGPAHATSNTLFGLGPRSASLAQADIAAAAPVAAAYTNPALASEPGARIELGYGHAWSRLEFNDRPAPVQDIRGVDAGLQLGTSLGSNWTLGAGLAMHLPDRSLARVSFRPGSEPSLPRFDPAPQRTTADVALGLRHGRASIGVGASLLMDAVGDVHFLLGQDGNGTYAEGDASVRLPYRIAPSAGLHVDLGPAAIAGRYRGAQAIGLDLATRTDVTVSGNPLNGTTTVGVRGESGYVPALADLGARWTLSRSLCLLASLQWARWSAAPSSAAELSMAVHLGLTPGQLEARFVRPALRDTLSPRLGVEVDPGILRHALRLRAGYAFVPSPVPEQRGLMTIVDSASHLAALGAGVDLGAFWGVALRADAAGQVCVQESRTFDKQNDALPFARFTTGGQLWRVSTSVEAAWR